MVLTLPISLIGEIKDISSRIDSIFEKFHILVNLERDNSTDSLNNLIIKVPNDIIVYYNEDNKCLNITCLVPKKNESSNLTEIITIDIKNILTYNMLILNKSNSSINKVIKKKKLTYIKTLPEGTLYSLNNWSFIYVDNNGFMHYYSDTLDILDEEAFFDYLLPKHYLTGEEINISNLPKLIEKNLYYQLNDILINPNSYSLYLKNNVTILDEKKTNNTTTSIIESWSNMLSFGLFGYIGGKLGLYSSNNSSSNVYSSINNNNNNNDNDIQNNNIKYYINNQTLTIIKENIKNKTYKIIKPRNINLPVYIDNIEYDDDNNILLSGKFNQTIKNCSIKLNKFLLHEQINVY